ncbi:MAG: diguanylate cyclase [Oscillospiraceae bacterium]|nr:diguanylate cyclase [Oscillospiraceae bacterium]
MAIQSMISITIEAFALIVSILISVSLIVQKRWERIDKVVLWMVSFTVLLLFNDILAYNYRGNTSSFARCIVRISNFGVFAINYLMLMGYGMCLRIYTKTKSKIQILCFRAVSVGIWISLIMLIISQFSNFLYYFDSDNFYHRGKFYLLTQFVPILGGIIYFGIIIANRKNIQRNELIALNVYLVLPFIGTLLQSFIYGYPIQTIACVLGCWGLYFSREVGIRNQLSKSLETGREKQNKLEKALSVVNEQYSVLKSMSEIFYSMHLIDLTNDSIKEFNAKNEIKETLNNPFGAVKMMADVISKVTSEDYKTAALNFTDLNTISDRMQNKKIISEEFIGNRLGWYRAQFITIENDAEGRPVKIIFTTQGIDEEKRQRDLLIKKSQTDELTGFYNRRAYEEDIVKYKDEQIGNDFVYISLDVNSLKKVNDTLGHVAGDELIVGACECMKRAFGDSGKLYRTGGDEFVSIISAGEKQLKKVLNNFEEITKNWSGNLVESLSVSYGVVTRKENPDISIDKMAIIADQRMYSQKREYYQRKGIDRRNSQQDRVRGLDNNIISDPL